jgi:hypothetical protein
MSEPRLIKFALASAVILPQLHTGGLARRRGYHSLCWILAAWPVAIPLLLLSPDIRMEPQRRLAWRRGMNALGLALSAVTVSTLSLVAYNLPAVLELLGVL